MKPEVILLRTQSLEDLEKEINHVIAVNEKKFALQDVRVQFCHRYIVGLDDPDWYIATLRFMPIKDER